MIIIKFKCNACGCTKGIVEVILEPIITCEACEETEEIKDFDIIGNLGFEKKSKETK